MRFCSYCHINLGQREVPVKEGRKVYHGRCHLLFERAKRFRLIRGGLAKEAGAVAGIAIVIALYFIS